MFCIVDRDTAVAMLRDSFDFWGHVVRAEAELGQEWLYEISADETTSIGTAGAVRVTALRAAMLSKALECGRASCIFESDGLQYTIAYTVRVDGMVRCLSETRSVGTTVAKQPRVVGPEYQLGLIAHAAQRAAQKASDADETDVAECQRLHYIARRYVCQLMALQLAMKEGISMVDVCLEGEALETVGYRRLPTGKMLEVVRSHQNELMGIV